MERHNWTLGKYDGSEFILGCVYLFVPDWIIVTSDFNLLWGLTSRPALQTFQMENVVWKQNKCFLGCVFSVLRTYQIWEKKIRRETELCLLKRWVCGLVNFPRATWWNGESPEVSCLSHPSPVPCPTTMFVASGSFSRLIYSLSVGLRKERMHNGSHWAAIPSPSYISNGKGIPSKMLLPVYMIPFLSQGQKIWNWMGIIVFVSEGASLWNTALTEAWGELAGLGWEAFLPPTIHLLWGWAFILPFWL